MSVCGIQNTASLSDVYDADNCVFVMPVSFFGARRPLPAARGRRSGCTGRTRREKRGASEGAFFRGGFPLRGSLGFAIGGFDQW